MILKIISSWETMMYFPNQILYNRLEVFFMNRVRQLREEKGWTQGELGKLLQVQKSAVSKYESGHVPLTDDTIRKLCTIFDVTADYIIGATNIRNKKSPLTDEQGELIVQRALKDTGLLSSDGSLSEKGGKVISDFIANNAALLKKLIEENE